MTIKIISPTMMMSSSPTLAIKGRHDVGCITGLARAVIPNVMLRGMQSLLKLSVPERSFTSPNGTALPNVTNVYYFDHNNPGLGIFQQLNWEFYEPRGPIILMTPGEDTKATPPLTSSMVSSPNKKNEHRFFGYSNPYDNLTSQSLALLTIQQAIDGPVYFATADPRALTSWTMAVIEYLDGMFTVNDTAGFQTLKEAFGLGDVVPKDDFASAPCSGSWFWMMCNQVGWYQVGPPEGQPAIRECVNMFPLAFQPTTAETDIMYAGWNVNIPRLFFVNGLRDPWLEATVSAEGLNKPFTHSMPIHEGDGCHCSGLITENGIADPIVAAVQEAALLLSVEDWCILSRTRIWHPLHSVMYASAEAPLPDWGRLNFRLYEAEDIMLLEGSVRERRITSKPRFAIRCILAISVIPGCELTMMCS
ncbi:hypothetical protein BDR05DRAFT_1046153 [Suillus weaverae]|nr:hypothetical protein BDR05DRAFT_1046153 [Suillus weaverae]